MALACAYLYHHYLLHTSSQYGELRPTSGWDRFRCLGHPQRISTGFASWLRYWSDVDHRRPTKLCGVEQRVPPIFGMATITLGIGPHSSIFRSKLIMSTHRLLGMWTSLCEHCSRCFERPHHRTSQRRWTTSWLLKQRQQWSHRNRQTVFERSNKTFVCYVYHA